MRIVCAIFCVTKTETSHSIGSVLLLLANASCLASFHNGCLNINESIDL